MRRENDSTHGHRNPRGRSQTYLCAALLPVDFPYRGLLLIAVMLTAACSIPPARVKLPTVGPRPAQVGVASWYGPGFHGQPTASGAIYDQHDLTAAHPTLPLGTRVMVTNLDNGRSVQVTINDRGPFVKGRIIDLSYAAGRAIGLIGPGTALVRVEVIDAAGHALRAIPEALDYTLQLGSFTKVENAEQFRNRLAPVVADIAIVPLRVGDTTYYRVQSGTFSNRSAAEERARQIDALGVPILITEKTPPLEPR
ncbi:MAG TPA: septal ring lytic transglycosylase RlpA family protein [Candidatus Eisenbacteria bacterium]|nr:septal ring lytic transglycosylase RlpA family protein [Candidatus Eisenbacteria bacterium]